MKLQTFRNRLEEANIFHSEIEILESPTVVGYHKQFRWSWMATQLNTFYVVTDLGDRPVTPLEIEAHLTQAFTYAKTHYKGWPRGLQSGIGVISILLSTQVSEDAITYCRGLKSGKKWAGFTIPVCIDARTQEVYSFSKSPMWGAIYYPYFKKMIAQLTRT